jgi:hypothetical protein
MKHRRHHNNTGERSIRSGDNEKKLQRIARKLGIPYGKPVKQEEVSRTPCDSTASQIESQ